MGKICRKDCTIGPYLKDLKSVKDAFLYLQPQILNPFGFDLNRITINEKKMKLASGNKMQYLILKSLFTCCTYINSKAN